MTSDADVLIVGGGIAGASAAYFARRAGRGVTVVDAGVHAASALPVALVNPLRGRAGRLVVRGVAGMHATFALVDALAARGHAIAHRRGLHRPLFDRGAHACDEAGWRERLDAPGGPALAFAWHAEAPASLGLATRGPSLFLPDAGWVEPRGLLDALAAEAAATRVVARVATTRRDGVVLADGTRIAARTVLWCGGAWGASLLDAAPAVAASSPTSSSQRSSPSPSSSSPSSSQSSSSQPSSSQPSSSRRSSSPDSSSPDSSSAASSSTSHASSSSPAHGPGRYKPGSLAAAVTLPAREPLTFGTYVVPHGGTTIVGPTSEAAGATFDPAPAPPSGIARLTDRVASAFGVTLALEPVWRGVRLVRLSDAAVRALAGVDTLTALGSRGFLLAPLLAAEWARSL